MELTTKLSPFASCCSAGIGFELPAHAEGGPEGPAAPGYMAESDIWPDFAAGWPITEEARHRDPRLSPNESLKSGRVLA